MASYTNHNLDYESKRQRCERFFKQLKDERQTFDAHWKDIATHLKPRRPKFDQTDNNRGDRYSSSIYDSTGTFALRTLASGMMSGLTSPARPWFELTIPDYELLKDPDVHAWLYNTTERMRSVFIKSNLYNVLPIIYSDLGAYGTAAVGIEEDRDAVIRFQSFPIGSYWCSKGGDGLIRGFARELSMTVREVINTFGRKGGKIDWSILSDRVRTCWENGRTEEWIKVIHIVKENDDYMPGGMASANKPYMSVYYEEGREHTTNSIANNDVLLRDAGMDQFRILVPRWEVSGDDVYGTDCPGMTALGDIKQLQLGEKRIWQAVEKSLNPPMALPISMRNTSLSMLPGDISYVPDSDLRNGPRALHDVTVRIDQVEAKQQQTRERIRMAFYEPLFLMLATKEGDQPLTATEVNERHEEKLLALGPVLEQVSQDLLDPLIDITFQIMVQQGLVEPPPPILEGQDLKVEYISIMSAAQKAVGLGSLERFSAFVAQMVSISPELADKINMDEIADNYGKMISVPPGVLRSADEVAQIRQQRAQAAQAAQGAEVAQQSARAAKDLASAETGGNNALNALFGGQ